VTNRWILGARPRTLPAAVVPVLVGTAVAIHDGEAIWWRAALALVVSLALQVGVNYANDYSDGVRGTDDIRVGPARLVASGLAQPKHVKRAAFLAFAVAGLAGLALVAVTNWWLIFVGIAAVLAAWYYTGGKHPYGYMGFGELFVFVFFGLVAVVGTAYVQLEDLTTLSWVAAVPVGLLSVALLVVNNLRDIPGDTAAGKRTLAVRLGDRRTRSLYVACVVGAVVIGVCAMPMFASQLESPMLLAAFVLWYAGVIAGDVMAGAKGRELIPVLKSTGQLQLAFGIVFAFGIAVG
jgi:1,4-dihydroxy-2-naphthoate octaprenyltransferase